MLRSPSPLSLPFVRLSFASTPPSAREVALLLGASRTTSLAADGGGEGGERRPCGGLVSCRGIRRRPLSPATQTCYRRDEAMWSRPKLDNIRGAVNGQLALFFARPLIIYSNDA